MLGLRYHVASLAAVFLALAVGILLGVAISGKISEADDALQRDKLQRLEQDLESARARSDSAQQRGAAAQQLVEDAYPALMEDRLAGRSVAVLFLGGVDGSARSEIEETLADAGSGSPVRVVGLDVPVDPIDLESTLEGDEVLAAYSNQDGDFGELGRELGRELVDGGETPLWTALSSKLVEERSGGFSPEADAVVVMYSWTPDAGGDSSAEVVGQTSATRSLLEGLVTGLDGTGVPVVGVAATGDRQSVIDLYRDQGISSVDDIDTLPGRLALALVLEGGQAGHYGVRDSATDGVTPPIEPVTTSTSG
jgi:copper transport outer membrane protein MctB